MSLSLFNLSNAIYLHIYIEKKNKTILYCYVMSNIKYNIMHIVLFFVFLLIEFVLFGWMQPENIM